MVNATYGHFFQWVVIREFVLTWDLGAYCSPTAYETKFWKTYYLHTSEIITLPPLNRIPTRQSKEILQLFA